MTFATQKFNAAVASFKSTFGTHPQLFTYGQFYVTNRTIDDMLGTIETELRGNIRFMLSPEQLENTLKWFHNKLKVDVREISVVAINTMLNLIEHNGDLAAIRAMFRSAASSKADTAGARADFEQIWSGDSIPAYPYWSASSASLGKALAARELEKDRCFQVSGALARKVAKAGAVAPPPSAAAVSDGRLAGADVFETVPAAPATHDAGQQVVRHANPAALPAAYARMRATIDAKGFVQCGVLSGARGPFPRPEHYVLAFAYDVVDGKDAFLFWDPDAARSNIASTAPAAGAPGWGPGFGVLFATPNRISTARDDADLAAIDRNDQSVLFGDHTGETRRHCYQVFSLQTLPLPKQVRVHTKVMAAPKHTSVDTMLQNAIGVYAVAGVEVYEASREELAEADAEGGFDRFRRLYCGFGEDVPDDLAALHETLRAEDRGFGVTPGPTDVVVAIVNDLVPAALGSPKSPEGRPGLVLSAGASEWTLAHELGHLLGLADVSDPAKLMHASTAAITARPPWLTDEDAATVTASPLAV